MPTNKAIRQANRVARAVASRTPHQPRCAMWPGNRFYAFCPSACSMAHSKSCASMGCGTEATARARVARRYICTSTCPVLMRTCSAGPVATQCSANSRPLRLSIAPLSRRYSQGYREVQPVVPRRWFASCPRSLLGILPSYFKVELYSSSLSLAWLAAWSRAAFARAILPVINCSIAA